MKYIGFIKEHNLINEAVPLNDLIKSDLLNHSDLIHKCIEYLNSGVLVFGWMGYFMDLETNKPIAPDSYYTDGIWIWPAYFSYYLIKYPNYPIDSDFIEYILNLKKETVFNIDLDAIETELSLKLNQ